METGARLGHYEVVEPIGVGGMGEVYRARDPRLDRDVAIKVLPGELAADPERLARFDREARAAAALSHPHIAAVYDVGSAEIDGTRIHYIVQELLQGRPLRELLESGPLPLKRLLALAGEIAEALRAAHDAGIVHRDLKPENVFVGPGGHAKVLDFGLAKLVEAAPAPDGGETESPTVLGTVAGAIMGTAGYMAPEQVEGGPVDRRADLFALGCLLHEMATGSRAFQGSSIHETLHKIGHAPAPDLGDRAPELPAELARIVAKLLEKDPADRYQCADDLVVDLRRLRNDVESGAVVAGALPGTADEPAPATAGRLNVPALLAVGALLLAAWGWWGRSAPEPPVLRADLSIPGFGASRSFDGIPVTISADGRRVAAHVTLDGRESILLRPLDSDEYRTIPTPVAFGDPTFSPDGRWIAYATGSEISVASTVTGDNRRIYQGITQEGGVDWAGNEQLVAPLGPVVHLLSISGGGSRELLRADAGVTEFAHPWVLPSGDRVLLTRFRTRLDGEIVVVDLDDGTVTETGLAGSSPMYVPGGYLVFASADRRTGTVVAFDAASATITGDPFPLPEPVALDSFRRLMMDVSDTGTLVYLPADRFLRNRLVWVDRDGSETPLELEGLRGLSGLSDPRISPDGERIALSAQFDIWAVDLPSRSTTLLASEEAGGGQSFYPLWVGNTNRILYAADRDRWLQEIYSRRTDSSAPEELVFSGPNPLRTVSWVSAHDRVLLREQTEDQGMNVLAAPLDGMDEPTPVLTGPYDEISPTVSADGRWIAYVTDETGRDEVWVSTYPEPGRRIQVSQEGGTEPAWSPDSSELYYWSGDRFHAARIDGDPQLRVADRELLFEKSLVRYRWHAQYDVHPDGDRFLMVKPDDGQANVRIVQGWARTLEELAAGR